MKFVNKTVLEGVQFEDSPNGWREILRFLEANQIDIAFGNATLIYGNPPGSPFSKGHRQVVRIDFRCGAVDYSIPRGWWLMRTESTNKIVIVSDQTIKDEFREILEEE